MVGQVMDLEEHIGEALRESCFPEGHNGLFASKNVLTAITNYSVTQKMWPDLQPPRFPKESDNKALVDFISQHAREIFAIGIYLNIQDKKLRDMMRLFMKHQMSDIHLPLSDAAMDRIWAEPRYLLLRRKFGRAQCLFRPHGFSMMNRFLVVPVLPNVVLPILESKNMSRGQFGIVYAVRIDEDFLDFNDPIRKVRRNEHYEFRFVRHSSVVFFHPPPPKKICTVLRSAPIICFMHETLIIDECRALGTRCGCYQRTSRAYRASKCTTSMGQGGQGVADDLPTLSPACG